MKIIVNDANILIDLADVGLLELLFTLNFEFHTTDFVLSEITKTSQRAQIDKLIEHGFLYVATTKAVEYAAIEALKSKNLSFEDCSVWYYTQKVGGVLLTGDGSLRKTAQAKGTPVRGILFVFDELVANKLLTQPDAHHKLSRLYQINPRLPKAEV